MDQSRSGSRNKARASTGIDATGPGPTLSTSMRGFPTQGRRRDASKRVRQQCNQRPKHFPKQCDKVRVATLNVGTMNARSGDLAKALHRRGIDLCALQETRWSGEKSRNLDDEEGNNGYKLLYTGSPRTRNGVGIVVSKRFRDCIQDVHRYGDRLMKLVIVTPEQTIHFFSAYAPQTGCKEDEKETFWTMLDMEVHKVPSNEFVIIGGDLNGHVGERSEGNRSHGGNGYGQWNEDGSRVLEFADAHDLIITNTWFRKRLSHLVTYYSGQKKSQIDLILVRRRDLKIITDTKVVPYETVAPQHRPVIATLRMKPPNSIHGERTGPARIRWWRMRDKEKEAKMILRTHLPEVTTADETWEKLKKIIVAAAHKTLGKTKPGTRFIKQETWLWTEEIKTKTHEKKRLYHAFLKDKTPANWKAYCEARKLAKKAIAARKGAHYAELYDKLDAREGEKDLFRLVKGRRLRTQDIERFHCVNDENGKLIVDKKAAVARWRRYFEKISTEEFSHPPIAQPPPVSGPVSPITASEVSEALKKMKPGKATGPDDIAAELWKAKSWNPSPWLAKFFNRIVEERRTPADWQHSTTVPIWKGKGSPADCANYRPIRLLSHTMKVFERILDKRIREIVDLTVNQAGFVKGCGTTDAIHAARMLVEKHREKNIPLHVAFLDLEKAFDRVPHELIWHALRRQQVPEELIGWVRLLYQDPKSRVRCAAGTSKPLSISVGVHQGSALSPLLFVLVMDVITRDLQRPAPYTLLYADDVLLADSNKKSLETLVQTWNDRLAQNGLRLNLKKTEYMTTDSNEHGTINISGVDLPRTEHFKYLGSTISADGSLKNEANGRINAAWLKWRSTTGVLCDRRMKDSLKSKVYRAVVRPVALYGSECWAVTKDIERRLAVMETRMLRWISGITRLDHVRNDDIRNRYGVVPITEKMREGRLRWYGHVLRSNAATLANIGHTLEVPGKRPKGRPKQRWLDTLRLDLAAACLHPDQAEDREKWRLGSSRADPASERDKGRGR